MTVLNINQILEKWDLRYWTILGVILQIILIFLVDFVYRLLPEKKSDIPTQISLSTDLSFIEYQEPELPTNVSQTKELSEQIIETTQKVEEKINWNNAVDPTLDFFQRYTAKIAVNISPDDYPERAKRSSLGQVKVSVAVYIGADGKIKDVKIRKIESSSGNIDLFEADFVQAVKKIFLQKAKLLNQPYQVNGENKDFIWFTTVTFTLE
ncbi:MAG: energy transducer TonB [Leptospiraceae bacterium]|nr:energy transducer TonB [Leptospiraceae bacterium]